jgi:hypothetical protein
MGDWWVLGNMPTPTEKNCHNALEQYALNPDQSVAVTFSCNKKSFDGKREVNHFTGLVQNPGTNTEWKIKMKLWGKKSRARASVKIRLASSLKRHFELDSEPRINKFVAIPTLKRFSPS